MHSCIAVTLALLATIGPTVSLPMLSSDVTLTNTVNNSNKDPSMQLNRPLSVPYIHNSQLVHRSGEDAPIDVAWLQSTLLRTLEDVKQKDVDKVATLVKQMEEMDPEKRLEVMHFLKASPYLNPVLPRLLNLMPADLKNTMEEQLTNNPGVPGISRDFLLATLGLPLGG
ncbi:hypothetical protein BC835DRAFT_1307476 [Cytidiella melzeri]|nr:hypothetical protein BC835DRAFT_1307476 [Cytidiella melzeri]